MMRRIAMLSFVASRAAAYVSPRALARTAARGARMSAVAEPAVVREGAPTNLPGSRRVRFAPSPTGTLHVGGARTALYNWLWARNVPDGVFVLRIEDTDEARSTRESEEAMIRDLRWLGLDWDEGPDVGGPCGLYRQSERMKADVYGAYAERLLASGRAYRCFCTEDELEASRQKAVDEGRNPQYDGTWRDADPAEVQRRLDEGEAHTVRFRVEPGQQVAIDDQVRGPVSWDAEATVGDFILLRSNGMPVYNFCVAIDDMEMGITDVIRAEEHLTNTLRQGLILEALGRPLPRYAHCSLILGEDRAKLSKRHGATSCDQFRGEGYLPEAMVNYLSLLGWNEGTDQEIYAVDELTSRFAIDRVIKSPSMFDGTKLKWINGQHLRAMPAEARAPLLREALVADGGFGDAPSAPLVAAIDAIAAESIELLPDAAAQAARALAYPLRETADGGKADAILGDDFAALAGAICDAHAAGELPAAADHAGDADAFGEAFKGWVKALGKDLGRKGKRLFQPVRLALTGAMSGPDIGAQLALLAAAEADGVACAPLAERMAALKEFAAGLPPPSTAEE